MQRAGRHHCDGRNKKLIALVRRLYAGGEEVAPEPGNEDIFRLLALGSRQWRMRIDGMAGMGGAVFYSVPCGIDFGAVIGMARGMGIETDQSFFEKLYLCETEALKIFHDKKEGANEALYCDGKQKEECKIMYGKHFEWTCKQCQEMKKGKDAG